MAVRQHVYIMCSQWRYHPWRFLISWTVPDLPKRQRLQRFRMRWRRFSIEVMPRTAAKIESFADLLPRGTRVYIAHIEGTSLDDMVATARRLADEGMAVMPHFPARVIKDAAELEEWILRYRNEAGVDQALLLAGGLAKPCGTLTSSIDMIETGLFDKHGFKRLHVAGHPEGNKDIDTDGSSRLADEALLWKQGFADKTDAEMAIVTQFVFAAQPIIEWADHIRAAGVQLPVHVGIAGPAKLQTMIKFRHGLRRRPLAEGAAGSAPWISPS